jgi:hypothetical protein
MTGPGRPPIDQKLASWYPRDWQHPADVIAALMTLAAWAVGAAS